MPGPSTLFTKFGRAFHALLHGITALLRRLHFLRAPHPRAASWAFFVRVTMRGPQELRPALGLDEAAFRGVAGFSHSDSRAYYLYAVLDEIGKTSVALQRWSEFLDSPDKADPGENLTRMILESVLDEQDARRRRLLELLVDLICFRTTNEQEYYRHYMLLQDARRTLSAHIDYRRFYGIDNQRLRAQAQPTLQWISQLEAGPVNVALCWYRDQRARPQAQPEPGRMLSSVRSRLQIALAQATEHEKIALGLSYAAYSAASAGVHFDPSRLRYADWLEQAGRSMTVIGILALNCLVGVQKLLGITPLGVSNKVREILEGEEIVRMSEALVGRRAEAGDFVLAYGDRLAEVSQVKKNQFGYESYCVYFLEPNPPSGIYEDWLPPHQVTRLKKLDQLMIAVREELIANSVPAGQLNAATLREPIRGAMVDVWNAGLRDHVLSEGRQRS